MVAGSCMAVATHLNSPIPDAIGSLLVGIVLGAVASFIIYSNSAALVGRSIPLSNYRFFRLHNILNCLYISKFRQYTANKFRIRT